MTHCARQSSPKQEASHLLAHRENEKDRSHGYVRRIRQNPKHTCRHCADCLSFTPCVVRDGPVARNRRNNDLDNHYDTDTITRARPEAFRDEVTCRAVRRVCLPPWPPFIAELQGRLGAG